MPIDIYKLILELNLILDLQFFPEYANARHTEAGKDFKNGQTGVHCNDDILLKGLFKNYAETLFNIFLDLSNQDILNSIYIRSIEAKVA